MDLCPEQKPDNVSHPYSIEAKCPSRSQVKNFQGVHRMDAQSKHFQGSGCPRVSHQIPKFISCQPEPNAVTIDTFNLTWNYHLSYLFPPFSLIPLCLKKILRVQAECILIAPVWKSRPWCYSSSVNIATPAFTVTSVLISSSTPRNKQDSHLL